MVVDLGTGDAGLVGAGFVGQHELICAHQVSAKKPQKRYNRRKWRVSVPKALRIAGEQGRVNHAPGTQHQIVSKTRSGEGFVAGGLVIDAKSQQAAAHLAQQMQRHAGIFPAANGDKAQVRAVVGAKLLVS